MAKTVPEELIIIFTRFPAPGKTKTRLIPALGARGAADLQRRMTEAMASRAKSLAARREIGVEIRFAGSTKADMMGWLGPGFAYAAQGEGDLGERMERALHDAIARGAARAVLVGTDLPGLSGTILEQSFHLLDASDLVLGPAMDGGYYLIGLKEPAPDLFSNIAWGTKSVLEETLRVAAGLGLKVATLPELADVDRPEDLRFLEGHAEYHGFLQPAMSVIIPALNEAENIEGAISSAAAAPSVEVIVADGGSSDGTAEIAENLGAKVVACQRGRAVQMNLGAKKAAGRALLFLHADSVLPPDYHLHVAAILKTDGVAAGAFEFAAASNMRGMRLIEKLANFRSRRLGLPYGDQAIFLRRQTFEEVGGFPEMELMEDFELVRRLKRLGKIETARASVLTSARRWERLGILRVTLVNQAVVLGFLLGIRPPRLARLYRR